MKYLKYLFMLIMLFSIDVYADNYSVDFNKKGKLNITLTDKEENKAIEFMELLYEKSNEYLSNPGYNETEESSLLERVADNIYEQTK